jgi:hypothetical protein
MAHVRFCAGARDETRVPSATDPFCCAGVRYWAAMALGIMAYGPGRISIDHLARHFFFRKNESVRPALERWQKGQLSPAQN